MTWAARKQGDGFVPNDGTAERKAARQKRANAGGTAGVKRWARARRARAAEQTDPRGDLLARARAGDAAAVATANALYGSSWREP